MMAQRTHTEEHTQKSIAQTVAEWDMSDRMLWASENPSTEDEQVGRLTHDIAEYLGISEEDEEGYDELNELVCERWAEEYEDFCQPSELAKEIIRDMLTDEWASYWEDEEWDSDSILTEERLAELERVAWALMSEHEDDHDYDDDMAVSEAVVIVAEA